MRAIHQIVIACFLVNFSAGSDHVKAADSSAAGFAMNSTIAVSPIPKKVTLKKNENLSPQRGKSAVPDAMELIDPKASEQVLELIVKIAEHPATWKQIHRVLETLEANNAAYSQRTDATRSELGWMNKRLDRPGDKRNDVPDEKVAILSNTSSTAVPSAASEMAFQHWRDVLFASTFPKEHSTLHPQLTASEMQFLEQPKSEQDVKERDWISTVQYNPLEPSETEKKFEERLTEIEEELKKLTKLSRTMPLRLKQMAAIAEHKQGRKAKSPKPHLKSSVYQNQSDANTLAIGKNRHPKFHYHKVQNTTSQPGPNNSLGPNLWKRIASLKHNTNSSVSKRNSFVAVSLSPTVSGDKAKQDESLKSDRNYNVQATEPLKPEITKLCKKNHNTRKQKAHQQFNRHAFPSRRNEKS